MGSVIYHGYVVCRTCPWTYEEVGPASTFDEGKAADSHARKFHHTLVQGLHAQHQCKILGCPPPEVQ